MRRDRKTTVRLGWTIVSAVFAATLWPTESRADENDDAKIACVAAADQGQLLRDGGKYSGALEQFKACADERCPTVVRQQCGVWLRQLIDSTPTMVFAATDPQGRDLAEVHVTADGHRLADELNGRPVAFDPGLHEIRFEAPGHEPAVTVVMIRAGDKNRLVSAILRDVDLVRAPPGGHASFWDGRAVTSLVLVVGSALSAGAGISFALLAQNEGDRADRMRGAVGRSGCVQPTDSTCASLSDTVDAQRRDALLSTGFYVASGALAAAATLAWIAWPPRTKHAVGLASVSLGPILGPTEFGLNVAGALE